MWLDINTAFSQPVITSDDSADYAPTQILAELFRSAGYSAIAYKSHFDDDGDPKGYNGANFDPEAMDIVRSPGGSLRSRSRLSRTATRGRA